MAKYRKKPVIVEAFQMTKERRWNNSDWPVWLCEAWQKEPSEEGCLFCVDDNDIVGSGERLCITTIEGFLAVTFDDWIICRAPGKLYLCRPAMFEATYEAEKAGGD